MKELCKKICACVQKTAFVCNVRPVGATIVEIVLSMWRNALGCGLCAEPAPAVPFPRAAESPAEELQKPKPVPPLRWQKKTRREDALQVAKTAETAGRYRLMTAIPKWVRLVNEDLLRESGYTLPHSCQGPGSF